MGIQIENNKAFVLKQIVAIGEADRTFNFIPGVKTKVDAKEFEALSKHPSFVRNCQDGILLVYENGVAQPQLFPKEPKEKKTPPSKPVEPAKPEPTKPSKVEPSKFEPKANEADNK